MHREEAIEVLCYEKIKNLTIQDCEDILLSWWGIDGNDENSLNRYSSPNHMTLADARLDFYNSLYKNGSKGNYESKDIIEQYYK